MDLFVGLDVSLRSTSVCILDSAGELVKEAKVESEPASITALLEK
ncbi:hypothetical protein PNH50_02705 [Leisingera aquaemixtae]